MREADIAIDTLREQVECEDTTPAEWSSASRGHGDHAPVEVTAPPAEPPLQGHDLPEIIRAFSQSAERLQATHISLQNEVRRLKRELRDTNEQLRRSRELAALGQMAAGIAHEIRNPLGSVRLYASMLGEDLDDRPECRQMAGKIEQAIIDLDAIVNDVLAFAREIKPRTQAVDPQSLVAQALENCAGVLHDSHISIRQVDLRDQSPTLDGVEVDASLINQALTNIIRNAIEAMDGQGELEFRFGPVFSNVDDEPGSVTANFGHRAGFSAWSETMSDVEPDVEDSAEPPLVLLEILDTGPGISNDILDRIFNPFFTTRSTGTGLGLAIAHRILDAHCGFIQILNRESGGTCVRLGLPAVRATLSSDADGRQPDDRP